MPGTGLSPDKMLLARGFSYSDAHRARLGVNYKQIPVNEPHVEVNAYSKDGAMRIRNATDPVYTPNSMGGPEVDAEARGRGALGVRRRHGPHGLRAAPGRRRLGPGRARWSARCSTTTRGTGWPHNIIGHVSDGVREPVLSRVFEYWRNVDPDLGKKVEEGVRAPKRNGDVTT